MNSDERIEVAERLRGKLVRELGFTAGSIAYAMSYTAPKGVVGDAAISDLLNRLADLIDPTCRVSDEEVAHQPTLDALAVHVYTCSACHNSFYMADVCCHPKPAYCPYCGARVVER